MSTIFEHEHNPDRGSTILTFEFRNYDENINKLNAKKQMCGIENEKCVPIKNDLAALPASLHLTRNRERNGLCEVPTGSETSIRDAPAVHVDESGRSDVL